MKGPIASLFLLLLPALAAADEFSEYRIPGHAWQAGRGALALNAVRSRRTYERFGEDRDYGYGAGFLSAELLRGHDSDRRQFGWQLYADGGAQASHERARSDFGNGYLSRSDDRRQGQQQRAGFAPWLRIYPGASPIGFELAAQVSAEWSQDWWRRDSEQELAVVPGWVSLSRGSEQNHAYDYTVRVRGAVGHGIVRDATVVEDVHVIEERLRAAGALSRPVSVAAREKLARLLAAAPAIGYAHDRPRRFAWREIERVLIEDGALAGGGLDAYALFRLAEPNVTRSLRRRGHFVGVTLGLEHDHHVVRTEEQYGWKYVLSGGPPSEMQSFSSERRAEFHDAARVGLLAEWHRPAGWAWQWTARATASMPVRAGERGLRTDAQLEASWRVTDRWLAQAGLRQARDYVELGGRDDSTPRDEWAAQSRASLSYFLEDRTSLFAELTELQGRVRSGYGAPVSSTFGRDTRLVAGLSYRFLGRASAPGLFEPMSLLR